MACTHVCNECCFKVELLGEDDVKIVKDSCKKITGLPCRMTTMESYNARGPMFKNEVYVLSREKVLED